MDTKTAVQIFGTFAESKPVQFALRRMSEYCHEDGKSRLEVALELYTGVREEACLKCRMAEKTVSAFLSLGGKAFGASSEEMKDKFRDKYWRRGLANVVKGISIFGVRKPFVPGAPFQVVWNVTNSCNLRCKHCYANAGQNPDLDLSTEDAKRVIDRIAEWGVVVLAFSGGEPLVRRDILELARHSSSRGLYTAIATNGVLLTKEKCRELREAGVEYLQISLDGAKAETHDSFRGVDGMFARTVEGIRNAVEDGFFVNIATTVTRHNLKEIPEMITLCEDLGVDWFMMYNFVPTGRGRFIEENDLSPREREDLLRMLWERMKTSKLNLLSTAPQFARVALEAEGASCSVVPTHFSNTELPGQLRSLADFIGGCGAGRFYIALEPNGDMTPCVFLPKKVGNILEESPERLWAELDDFRRLRDRGSLQGGCGSCDYRFVCGGCRARAYGYFGDFTLPDPGCIRNEDEYAKLTRIQGAPQAV